MKTVLLSTFAVNGVRMPIFGDTVLSPTAYMKPPDGLGDQTIVYQHSFAQ
ncbi:hypothetical protein ACFO25_16040 [Paenactinomyces guangxiensis]|uniref:Uncharacterized protein n=1 Tax=Paenactinomyces guangxiensis TaxID=1490290 RepID=A0A7W1WTN2_9BACL|nr:hypothetical protein [Paenactinomyces guangxiensis]MBA4495850.1 hypothetical protein [Paenactinomyces guangxiensis]MBH8593013.1 hypothetical protein [Paenactinomyces guangxiensis]